MYLLFWSGPKLFVVRGRLPLASPYPSIAGPLAHDASLKANCTQVLPGLDPLSRYFQTEPVETSVTGDAGGPSIGTIHILRKLTSVLRSCNRIGPRAGVSDAPACVETGISMLS